ncbi:MAG: hypothetical protein GY716_12150 [bacterium]|nr:hypothetical protein [bacterium]
MNGPRCLLDQVQGLLERTYHMYTGLESAGRFVIGHRGYKLLYAEEEEFLHAPRSGAGCGAKVLFRETGRSVRAALFFPDEQIERLERFPPQRGLGDENVDAFAALVEELDHLLVLAERVREQRTVSMFELELHANVSKHLVLTRFLAGNRPALEVEQKLWLRHHLFGKIRFTDPDTRVRARYRDARRWGVRFLDALGALDPAKRLRTLRRFHSATSYGKTSLIRSLAA